MLESDIIAKNESVMQCWFRYVDDVFLIIEKENDLKLMETLNTYHKDIRFTSEEEQNGELPFLDVMVYRKDGNLGTKVFRKSTHSVIYLNFSSINPESHKISVADTLIRRAI